MRPCLKCANVLKKNSEVTSPSIVEIDCIDEQKFVANTDEEVWRQFDLLMASVGVVGKGELEARQKAAGLTIVNNGVLSDMELRRFVKPVSSHTYDWMHTWLSNGVCSVEVYKFLQACKGSGFNDVYPKLEEYCKAEWCFPYQHRSQARSIHSMFCKSREAASKEHWRSSASELLTGYPLLRHFAERVVAIHYPALQQHVESLCLCFRVVDILQDTKGGTIDTSLLQRAIVQHLRKHRSVYGPTDWLPKLHFALHLPRQVERDQVLTDCFVLERPHLLPKTITNEIKNPITFERSAIARVLLARMQDLERFDERPGLMGKDVTMCPELSRALGADAVLSSAGRFDGIHIQRGDVLLVDGYTFHLSAVCKSDDRFFFLGAVFDSVRYLSPSSGVWRLQSGLQMLQWREQRVRRCHAWTQQADGTWLTLHPALR